MNSIVDVGSAIKDGNVRKFPLSDSDIARSVPSGIHLLFRVAFIHRVHALVPLRSIQQVPFPIPSRSVEPLSLHQKGNLTVTIAL